MKYLIITLISLSISAIPVPSNGQEFRQTTTHEPVKQIGSLQAPSKPVKPKVPTPKPKPQPKPPKKAVVKPKPVGTCEDWIAQAGITEKESARELIRRESQCRPHAVNPSSGACGVAQELPCGKSGCSRYSGSCQVKWMNKYVIERYGSWASALSFHTRNNWY